MVPGAGSVREQAPVPCLSAEAREGSQQRHVCLASRLFRQGEIRELDATQTWCRGKKLWESELLCLDCHKFSWRSYKDPDFKTPEEYERDRWEAIVAGQEVTIA